VKNLEGGHTVRSTYWESFFSRLKHFLIDELPLITVIREKNFTHNDIPIDELTEKNVMLYGYFQSYKYFEENYKVICKLIGLENMKTKVMNKVNFTENDMKNMISLHFRLGDYKNIQDFHPLVSYEYYEKSIEFIQNKNPTQIFTVIYFCEDDDLEEVLLSINKLTNTFINYNFIRCDTSLADWEQLLLMSVCHHNIIANSSFSWWGAYFNSNIDKIICYPSVWFGKSSKNDTCDLCPSNWNKINI
jgi:hypothetical protein